MKPFYLEAKTISDAWFQLIYNIFDNSYKQEIQRGSFEEVDYRYQYPGASIYIEYPRLDMMPEIPAHLGIPSPTSREYIDDYFLNYLMGTELSENETYTYGSRINQPVPKIEFEDGHPVQIWREKDSNGEYKCVDLTQIGEVIKMLRKTPMTNHAVIEVANPIDITACVGKDGKNDPPCLRLIDFKVIPKPCPSTAKYHFGNCPNCDYEESCNPNEEVYNQLTMSVYFRSWDLWAGLPTNLGGLELLKQYVAQEAGLVNGPIYAYSSGLHIYGYQEEVAKIRTMKND